MRPARPRRIEAVRRRERVLRGGAEAARDAAHALEGALLAPVAIVAALGVVMVYSATAPVATDDAIPARFLRHVVALALGVGTAIVAARVPLSVWRRLALPLWVGSVVLLVAVALFGVEVNGARRWLAIPGAPLRFQPAEMARWATLLAVAAMLVRSRVEQPIPHALVLAGTPAALMLLQPDFGSAALLLVLVGLLLFVAGLPMRQLLPPALAAGAVGVVYVLMNPYARARWTGFLDPWRDPSDKGFQLVQSFVAFGRGGTFGMGLGDGRQKLSYLPEAHTDFILAIVAEELGLLGVLVVLGAFAALVVAGLRVAHRASDPFAALVAFAMTALLTVPAALNAGVVMGVLPTTGFTLPFLSFGGTSLIASCLGLGILVRIALVETGEAQASRGRAARSRR